MEEILEAASRASTVGNMQLYSIIVTTSRELLEQLAPLHFNQPAATTAPVLLTFCADIHRFSRWCELRGAEPGYDNFCWFMNGVTDALLASQNACLEAEAHGLGICYLGTTLYNAGEIARILRLPKGVLPVMTVAMGYPETLPPLTDRLPLDIRTTRPKGSKSSGASAKPRPRRSSFSRKTGCPTSPASSPNAATSGRTT